MGYVHKQGAVLYTGNVFNGYKPSLAVKFLPQFLNIFLVVFLTEYIKKYATEEVLKDQEEMSSSSESSISDFSEDEAQDMELWHTRRHFCMLGCQIAIILYCRNDPSLG